MILIYAFSNPWGTNISRRTLSELQKIMSPFHQGEMSQSDRGVLSSKNNSNIDFQIVHFQPKAFFQKYIINSSYNLIIGLGDLYGNSSKIHIETQAKNSYNQQSIYPFYPIFLDLSIPPLDYYDSNIFSISSNMGTFNCNWIAFSTQIYLNQKNSQNYQLFLHLPPRQNASYLASQIKILLENNHLL